MALYVFLGVDRSIIDGAGGCINFSLDKAVYMYVYNRNRLMGLDYILNIYCYSESHASCEANHQVKQNNKCQAWRRCVARRT